MDPETREDLKEIGVAVQATGRRIASAKSDLEDLEILAQAMVMFTKAIRTYIRVERRKLEGI